jgi:SAM-dependent methyltransferase
VIDHYERMAKLELARRHVSWGPVDLAIHRRMAVPPGWKVDNPHEPQSSYLYDYVADVARLPPNVRILDLGCGFGAGMLRLGRTLEATGIGITTSATQVAHGNHVLASAGLDQSELLEKSLDAPTSGAFGAAIAIESLVHAKDLHATLQHVANALVPGGVLVVVDDLWGDQIPQVPEAVLGGWGIARPTKLNELLVALNEARLHVTICDDITSKVKLIDPLLRRLATLALRRAAVAKSGRSVVISFYAAQVYLQEAMSRGELRYQIVVAHRL